jgi:nicotinic acid mononucleotide adenylyltransferase
MINIRDKYIWIEEQGSEPRKLLPELEVDEKTALEVCQFLGLLHPLFSDAQNVLELDEVYKPFLNFDFTSSPNVVLFPGSFSPWHRGHEACVLGQNKGAVVVIPDFNPWKKVRDNSTWKELQSLWRFALEASEVSLFVGFLAKKEGNPTVSWLPKLGIKEKWLLMGDDSFLSLHKWKDSQLLLHSLAGLLVCPRMGRKDELKKQADFLRGSCSIKIEFLEPHPFQNLSSTDLRKLD